MAGWVKVGEVQVKRDWYDIYEKNKRFTWLVWGSKDYVESQDPEYLDKRDAWRTKEACIKGLKKRW